MSSSQKSFLFAFLMCVICSLVLTATNVGLKERKAFNVKLDQQKNILKALGLLDGAKKLTGQEIVDIYNTKVEGSFVTQEGALTDESGENALPIYILRQDGEMKRYAVPFSAYGLWSWVYGYVAFEGDGDTIAGITVYKHGETPGLGGEVEKPWFQNQFVGKKIIGDDGQFVGIGVVKGKVDERIPEAQRKHYVDGMSGATITGVGFEKYLKEDLLKYEPYASTLRLSSEEDQ